ncbi:alpha/beta hydrolase [Shewanella morhuae]|uniref:Alpha/beta hydrolase n=1 Tax=Shewanella morhuae TaxID=365591 RepID=A0ABX5HWN1_9GAMM|nr:alpha/beta fold hydrolase [Shewanella morhuae]PTA50638.1 alpha/beta hydrolase [Shewanella morhuae]GIU08206.1 proline iminopeptidase Pip [Shewanella morhuae]SIR12415.1 prolyl aminopeptidase 2. Serine peptidase. MEROPS family S33 [Shewanella morhuae]
MKPDIILADVLAKKHTFTLPLNYQHPIAEQIHIFARELCSLENKDKKLPYLVFFQGGPGFAAMRPASNSGWLRRALKEYRVLLLDQRGTGLSTPINHLSLKHLDPIAQADYLSHFRADNIVRDAEAIRAQLCPADKWAILGQSFGGFCVLHYLSSAPQGISEAYITGGIPSLSRSADDVYLATYQRVLTKNKQFFQRFHDAQHLATRLAKHLCEHEVYLATGERLTVEMLQLLGINIGMEQGPESVYYLLEQALIDTASGVEVNPLFLNHFSQLLDYNTNPIFALLHEAIYCQHSGSQWAAHRMRQHFPAFNYQVGKALLFTGEMIYPWMFDQFSHLMPLKAAAEILAHKTDWPALYNLEQLAQNRVPVAAAIYSEDMFVEMQYSLETAQQVGRLKYWLTSEYEHNGIRMDGERILDKLISLNRGQSLR